MELGIEIGDRLLLLILDVDQRRREPGDLELLRDHQRNGLPGEENGFVVKGSEWRARRGGLVRVFLVRGRDGRSVVVSEHLDHAGHGKRGGPIDALDATLRDRA